MRKFSYYNGLYLNNPSFIDKKKNISDKEPDANQSEYEFIDKVNSADSDTEQSASPISVKARNYLKYSALHEARINDILRGNR